MQMTHLRFWSSPAPKHSSVIPHLLGLTAGIDSSFILSSFGCVPAPLSLAGIKYSWCEFWRPDSVVIPTSPESELEGIPKFSHGLNMTVIMYKQCFFYCCREISTSASDHKVLNVTKNKTKWEVLQEDYEC